MLECAIRLSAHRWEDGKRSTTSRENKHAELIHERSWIGIPFNPHLEDYT